MRSSQKNIFKMKRVDLEDNVIDNENEKIIQSNYNDATPENVVENNISAARVEWNFSVSRPSFSVPESNTSIFYKNVYENLLKQTPSNQLEIENIKVNPLVNAVLSPRMNFRASKSLSTRESSLMSTTEDEEGLVQINQYKVLRDLGRGAYGFVKLVEDRDENLYALKIISKRKLMKSSGYFRRPPPLRNTSTSSFCEDNSRQTMYQSNSPSRGNLDSLSLQRSPQRKNLWAANSTNDSSIKDAYLDPLRRIYQEVAIYKKLDNPHIVKLHEVIDETDHDNMYMIFEHIEGGPVMNVGFSDPLSEELTRKYFRDIVCGLDYLHFNKIVHRDIKPSNLLVDKNGLVKLIDFGVSCQFTGDDIFLQDTLGSPAFLAPECVQDCHGKFTGKALDIWALGMTLHCFLFGKVAFDSRNKIDLYHSIATKPIILPQTPEISSEVKDLLTKMLNKIPEERITLNDIKEHPWVTENGNWAFPHKNQHNSQQIEVSDNEIDHCTVKPVRIQTIVSALMMARRRSFRNPKKSFDNFIKFEDPRNQTREFNCQLSQNSHPLGDQIIQSTFDDLSQLDQSKSQHIKPDPTSPGGEINSNPTTSQSNIRLLKNIFTRLNFGNSESTTDN